MASSEAAVVGRVRVLILLMFVLGGIAAAHGTAELRFWVLLFFVPGPWTFSRPYWASIVLWILWATTFGLLGFVMSLGTRAPLLTVSHVLMGIVLALLCIGLPLLRHTREAPRPVGEGRIPRARVHRGE